MDMAYEILISKNFMEKEIEAKFGLTLNYRLKEIILN